MTDDRLPLVELKAKTGDERSGKHSPGATATATAARIPGWARSTSRSRSREPVQTNRATSVNRSRGRLPGGNAFQEIQIRGKCTCAEVELFDHLAARRLA